MGGAAGWGGLNSVGLVLLYSVCFLCFSFSFFTYISVHQSARDLPYVVYRLLSPAPSHFVSITLRPLLMSRSHFRVIPSLILESPSPLPSPFVSPER